MKVLLFIVDIDKKSGGPSRSVPILAKGLAETGSDITLMTIRSNEMNTGALLGTSVKLKILEPDYSIVYLEKYIKSEAFDIIQVQSMWNLKYHQLKKIADKYNIPYIITPRGMLEPWSLSQKKWKKKLALWLYQMKDLNNSACIYTTAEMEAKHVKDLGVKAPVSVIPNGIETDEYTCRNSLDKVEKQVLFLSRIHEKKGIELLIDVWKNLQLDFQDWKLLIVGNGEEDYINSLNLRLKGYGLQDCIQILPPVFGKSKSELYRKSSLFVLPSYSENFGMVIAEAMSCGVPVITTKFTPWEMLNGDKESVDNPSERLGWCIDLSIENLESALREAMATKPEKLYEMGLKSSKFIDANFNYLSVAKKTKALYEWILNKGVKPEFVYE